MSEYNRIKNVLRALQNWVFPRLAAFFSLPLFSLKFQAFHSFPFSLICKMWKWNLKWSLMTFDYWFRSRELRLESYEVEQRRSWSWMWIRWDWCRSTPPMKFKWSWDKLCLLHPPTHTHSTPFMQIYDNSNDKNSLSKLSSAFEISSPRLRLYINNIVKRLIHPFSNLLFCSLSASSEKQLTIKDRVYLVLPSAQFTAEIYQRIRFYTMESFSSTETFRFLHRFQLFFFFFLRSPCPAKWRWKINFSPLYINRFLR